MPLFATRWWFDRWRPEPDNQHPDVTQEEISIASKASFERSYWSCYWTDFGTSFEKPPGRCKKCGWSRGTEEAGPTSHPFLRHVGSISFWQMGKKNIKKLIFLGVRQAYRPPKARGENTNTVAQMMRGEVAAPEDDRRRKPRRCLGRCECEKDRFRQVNSRFLL